jgi:hypothetical protein
MSLRQIVAYNVGSGECLLLIFGSKDEKYMLLVDFGTNTLPRILKEEDVTTQQVVEQWERIRDDIKKQMSINGVNQIDFLLTHCHRDHYNGLAGLDDYIDKVYSGTDLKTFSPKSGKEDYIFNNPNMKGKINLIQKDPQFLLHTYRDQTQETINILWPLKTVQYDSFSNFLHNNFPGSVQTVNADSMYREISTFPEARNCTSVVFEATGADGELYLFTGDINDSLHVEDGSEKTLDTLPLTGMEGKYAFVKMPHHGKEIWPLAKGLLKDNGKILVSCGKSEKENKISWKAYCNKYQIYVTNIPENLSRGAVSSGIDLGVVINI